MICYFVIIDQVTHKIYLGNGTIRPPPQCWMSTTAMGFIISKLEAYYIVWDVINLEQKNKE